MIYLCFNPSPGPETNFIYLWIDQNTSTNIRKYMETPWTNIIFVNMWLKNLKISGNICVCLGYHVFFWFSSLIFTKIIFSQDVPIYFLIFFEVFWYNKSHKYGAPGLGKSRNHEKSRIWCLEWWNRDFIRPIRSGKIQLSH